MDMPFTCTCRHCTKRILLTLALPFPPSTDLSPASQCRGVPGHGAWQPEPHTAPIRSQCQLLTLSRSVPGLCPLHALQGSRHRCVCVYVHAHTLVCLCVCLQVSMAKLSLTDQEESEHATVTANHGEWMREGPTFTTLC